MNDAVTDGDKIYSSVTSRSHAPASANGRRHIRNDIQSIDLIDERRAVGRLSTQPRPRADAFHLAFDQPCQTGFPVGLEDLKLDAR